MVSGVENPKKNDTLPGIDLLPQSVCVQFRAKGSFGAAFGTFVDQL
jgi:hypothetical protein